MLLLAACCEAVGVLQIGVRADVGKTVGCDKAAGGSGRYRISGEGVNAGGG